MTNASLFVYRDGEKLIYFLVYLDDLIVTGNNEVFIRQFITQLSEKFSLRELAKLNFFLGVEVLQIFSGLFLS